MIAVIADDLTGAAELGGIALQFDLKVEITTSVNAESLADVIIIATDTRSVPQKEAIQIARSTCEQLLPLEPNLVFKKIDSVLRGHILEEIRVQQEIFNEPKALIIPANPSLGRTIINGEYLLNGTLIHQSNFANDPEFPIQSSGIPKMLRSGDEMIHVLKSSEPLPDQGFIVGEVLNKYDLKAWTDRIDNDTAIAGAAEFFTAILEKMHLRRSVAKNNLASFNKPIVIVRGSSYYAGKNQPPFFNDDNIPVYETPKEITAINWLQSEDGNSWINAIVNDLNVEKVVVVAVPSKSKISYDNPVLLRERLAEVCGLIVAGTKVNEMIIEGGSTASTILRVLGITTLYPVQSFRAGVIRMSVENRPGLHITVKPGSYKWPTALMGSVIDL